MAPKYVECLESKRPFPSAPYCSTAHIHALNISPNMCCGTYPSLRAKNLTLQAWRVWHDTLDICPRVAEFLHSGPGLAFLHRLVIAFHLVCVEVGACGMRLVCLFLNLTGLNRFVAASYGAPQQVNFHVEHAMVTYPQDETARLAQDMPHQDLTVQTSP